MRKKTEPEKEKQTSKTLNAVSIDCQYETVILNKAVRWGRVSSLMDLGSFIKKESTLILLLQLFHLLTQIIILIYQTKLS